MHSLQNCKAAETFLDITLTDVNLLRIVHQIPGGPAMIQWESDINKALARGQAEKKCVLLDFFSPG
ncbi:hypothetical protein JCM15764A_02270 [Geotalea toluenoxydans]